MDMKCKKTDLFGLETPSAVAAIRRIEDGFKAFQVLRAGYDCGLFDWLEQNGPTERPAIAAALNLRGEHLGGFIQALEDLGLLERQDGRYTLANGMRSVLVADSPWHKASELEGLLAPACGWSNLGNFMSRNWTPTRVPEPKLLTQHPFLGEAQRLAAHLKERRKDNPPRTLLSFDASNGLFTTMLCQCWPDVRATIIVPPDALPCTEHTLNTCDMTDRCCVLPGTPLDPATGDLFDYVVMFHDFYHVHMQKVMEPALASVASRIAPGGELCSAHWFCLQACETAPGGLRDLDRAVLTDHHPLCGVERFCQRLEEAGLTDAEQTELAGEYGNTKLHFACRPNA